MMKFAGICLVTEHVPELRDFYARLLGVEAEGDDNHAEMKTTPTGMAIFSTAGMEAMAPGSMKGSSAGRVTLMFEVEAVEAEYARVQAMGLELVKPLQTHPWGARSFWFRDPDGNLVDFYVPAK
jgi:catechol 2,3-dioxygenase-like lactoylglutathione lyase family enzyme